MFANVDMHEVNTKLVVLGPRGATGDCLLRQHQIASAWFRASELGRVGETMTFDAALNSDYAVRGWGQRVFFYGCESPGDPKVLADLLNGCDGVILVVDAGDPAGSVAAADGLREAFALRQWTLEDVAVVNLVRGTAGDPDLFARIQESWFGALMDEDDIDATSDVPGAWLCVFKLLEEIEAQLDAGTLRYLPSLGGAG